MSGTRWRMDTLAANVWDAAPPLIKHWGRFLCRPMYRKEWSQAQRFHRLPRYTRATTDLLGKPLTLVDAPIFPTRFQEIFRHQIYRFESRKGDVRIIDCGANIGLTLLYFKKLFPQSAITAFEADPDVFAVLQENCRSFGLDKVELICKAVSDQDGEVSFLKEGSEAGRIEKRSCGGPLITVPTCRLKSFLVNGAVDLLKIDVEGAETAILEDCHDELKNVGRVIVEYHSMVDRPQTLDRLLTILRDAGFRVHLHTIIPAPQPLIERGLNLGMDLQINIFAFRD